MSEGVLLKSSLNNFRQWKITSKCCLAKTTYLPILRILIFASGGISSSSSLCHINKHPVNSVCNYKQLLPCTEWVGWVPWALILSLELTLHTYPHSGSNGLTLKTNDFNGDHNFWHSLIGLQRSLFKIPYLITTKCCCYAACLLLYNWFCFLLFCIRSLWNENVNKFRIKNWSPCVF